MEAIDDERISPRKDWCLLQCIAAGHIPYRCKLKRLDLIEILLKSEKFDVRVLTSHSQTLLHLLLYQNRSSRESRLYSDEDILQFVNLLLENNIDRDHKDENGQTALALASANEYGNVVDVLEENKIDSDQDLPCEDTELNKTARNKYAITFHPPDSEILARAIINKDAKLVQGLLNSEQEWSQCFELLCAPQVIKSFRLKMNALGEERPSGCRVSFSDWLLSIRLADILKDREILDILLRFEKIVYGISLQGWNVLHFVMYKCQHLLGENVGLFKTVEILLDSGRFDVNASTNQLETVLHFACRCRCQQYDGGVYWGFLRILRKLLLIHSVKVNQRNLFGQTALMIACENECSAAVRALVEWKDVRGVRLDISAKDNDGQTAVSIARKSNNSEILSVLKQTLFLVALKNCGVEPVPIYLSLLDCDNKRYFEEIEVYACRSEPYIDYSATEHHLSKTDFDEAYPYYLDLNAYAAKVQSTLNDHISYSVWLKAVSKATKNSHEQILKLFLEDTRFNYGDAEDRFTVLHLAVNQYLEHDCKPEYFIKLHRVLQTGTTDVNALDNQGDTALHMVCKQRSMHPTECRLIVCVLLDQEADLNQRNVLGKTALMLACENGDNDIVKVLLTCSRIPIDFDAVDIFGETALMMATRNGHSKTVDFLEMKTIFMAVENRHKGSLQTVLLNNCQISSGSDKPKQSINLQTWKEAVLRADGKRYKDILELLLNHDPIVQGQFDPKGDGVLHNIIRDAHTNNPGDLRALEILLTSGKVNVDAINFDVQTALHLALKTKESHYYENDEIFISRMILLLLRHNANVNQKDINGDTPLAIASDCESTTAIRTILNWANDTGTWLDLDATDHHGETALIRAARSKRPEAIRMLLAAGASVNLCDNHGFNVLHHALHENMSDNVWINFGDFPRNCTDLSKRKEIKCALFDIEEPNINYRRSRNRLNEDRMMIVKLLLERSDVDVNALNFDGYSPLDIAEATIPEINSSITETLKQKGATLNIFRCENQYLTRISSLNTGFENLLHRIVFALGQETYDDRYSEEMSLNLDPTILKQLVASRDQKGRTPLHWISIYRREYYNRKSKISRFLQTLFQFGCRPNVNDTDVYGRTALHYVDDSDALNYLIAKGADAKVKDRHGISAIKMAKWRIYCKTKEHRSDLANAKFAKTLNRFNETYAHYPSDGIQSRSIHISGKEKRHGYLSSRHFSPKLWKGGKYACDHPAVNQVTREVKEFMESLAFYITKYDPRFEAKPLNVGSSYEGTRLTQPDEFDFSFILTKISPKCEVISSPELPPGFVYLRRKQGHKENASKWEFDSFFGRNEMLMTEKIAMQFRLLVNKVLIDNDFVENQQHFEWHLCTSRLATLYESWETHEGSLAVKLDLTRTKFYSGSKSSFETISIDIVPSIHIDNYWPEEAIPNVSPEIRAGGCNLVLGYTQKMYPWVPSSECRARISFAQAESEVIKRSSCTARRAFMVGKQMIHHDLCYTNYVLKNCFLYCVEILEPTSAMDPSEPKFDFRRMDFRIWLEILMKCHFYIVSQDFCPCYFMPTFASPIKGSLKSYYMRCMTVSTDNLWPPLPADDIYARILSRRVSLDKTAPLDPLQEHFDRTKFIAEIREDAFKKGKQFSTCKIL